MKTLRAKAKNLKTTAWVRKNLSRLMKKYPGKYLVAADDEVFIGSEPSELAKKARAKHPKSILTCLTIPRPEDFACAL